MGSRRRTAAAALALAASVAGVRPAAAQAPTSSTWDSVYTAGQAARGRELYAGICSACHGPDLGGIDAAPALVGGRFASNWNGITLGDMVERIRVSMPQNAPGTLSRAQVADVTAYLLEQNGFPAGERELPSRTALLRMITYEAYRPAG